MKLKKSLMLSFGLLVITASLYRVWPNRPYGFAPQMAMALFAGSMVDNKRFAFILPLLSMFISDVFYQLLYVNGLTTISGFYSGQWLNYTIIGCVTLFGFLMKKISVLRVTLFSMGGSVLYFLLSNAAVWMGGGGFNRPKTFSGLLLCYNDGLAFLRDYGVINGFYGNLFIGDLFFCAILFGGFYVIQKMAGLQKQMA